MRAQRVGVVARRFYEELPAALAGAASAPLSARERARAGSGRFIRQPTNRRRRTNGTERQRRTRDN